MDILETILRKNQLHILIIEAEQKAKELMGKTEYEMYQTINPVKVPNLKELEHWTFGDLKLDKVYVEED